MSNDTPAEMTADPATPPVDVLAIAAKLLDQADSICRQREMMDVRACSLSHMEDAYERRRGARRDYDTANDMGRLLYEALE